MRKVIKKAGVFALTATLVLTGIALPVKRKKLWRRQKIMESVILVWNFLNVSAFFWKLLAERY